MEPLKRDRRVLAFKAADAFALEVFRVSGTLRKTAHGELLDAMRRAAVRSGGALVAASASTPGGANEREYLCRARDDLVEGRYYVYLARRLGLLDLKRYRGLTNRQEVALRELEALLSGSHADRVRAPP